ncbi:nicotinate-nucleotide adenylyltransferase [bacterium]
MKIGLFGGTFNPIHNGHLIIAKEIKKKLDLDYIYFIVSGNPPHKSSDVLHFKYRYQMTAMAIQDTDCFKISPVEINSKYKYTYQTINYFKKKFPDDEIVNIIGEDSYLQIDKWKKGKSLFDMCKFVVYARFGKVKPQRHCNVIFVNEPIIGISATKIRNKIRSGKNIEYLLPNNVSRYIVNHKFYRRGKI